MPPSGYAVLSPFFRQQLQDLFQPDPTPLDQADDHPHMAHDRHGRVAFGLYDGRPRPTSRMEVTLAVLMPLLLGMFAIEGRTAPVAFAAPMRFTTTEPTAHIMPTHVARVGEEQYPALLAALQVPAQIRPLPQKRPHLGIVRPDQGPHRLAPVPPRLTLELRCDLGCYKPRR
jgi:hypothetical protein